MPARAQRDIIATAADARKLKIARLKAHCISTNHPHAKFESREASDQERRRAREGMRKLRAKKRRAAAKPCWKDSRVAKPGQRRKNSSAAKPAVKRHVAAKPCRKDSAAAKPGQRRSNSSAAKPAAKRQKHINRHCCGRRPENCKCFTEGRGLKIANSFKRNIFKPIPDRVAKSRIQTWRDTGDMPGYMRQIGWNASMRYSWLFPIAFMWRHFSNEEFWAGLKKMGAVLQNQTPDFARIEKAMRAFQAKQISYHGGLFYSGRALRWYRFGSAAKPAEWKKCEDNRDFISNEILALKIMWHVARTFKQSYDSLQRQPSRQCWKACTQDFLAQLHEHTVGCFSDYALKITLDGVLLSQPCLEQVISWWPMKCKAYTSALPELYPVCRRSQDDLLLAGCHFHHSLKARFPKFYLRDSLAQTCWMKRGVS